MEVKKVATIGEAKPNIWFSLQAITNIFLLKHVASCYYVAYDSYNQSFIVWWEDIGLPNMIFKMYSSGLHFYNPKRKEFSFVVTVDNNMKMFSKQQIVGTKKAWSL